MKKTPKKSVKRVDLQISSLVVLSSFLVSIKNTSNIMYIISGSFTPGLSLSLAWCVMMKKIIFVVGIISEFFLYYLFNSSMICLLCDYLNWHRTTSNSLRRESLKSKRKQISCEECDVTCRENWDVIITSDFNWNVADFCRIHREKFKWNNEKKRVWTHLIVVHLCLNLADVSQSVVTCLNFFNIFENVSRIQLQKK